MSSRRDAYLKIVDEHWHTKTIELGPQGATFEESVQKLEEQHARFRAQLDALSQRELAIEVAQVFAEQDQHRPFNDLGSEADFEHFGKCSILSADEGAALLMGKDPRFVTTKAVLSFLGNSIFAHEYASRLDLIERAIAFGRLRATFTPLDLITWANEVKINVPADFIHHTFVRGEPIRYWHDYCLDLLSQTELLQAELEASRSQVDRLRKEIEARDQPSLGQWADEQDRASALNSDAEARNAALQAELQAVREVNASQQAMLQELQSKQRDAPKINPKAYYSAVVLATTGAIKGYGFDPSRERNKGAVEIADDARLLGFKMTDETALRVIREGIGFEGYSAPRMNKRKPKSAKPKPKPV
ncbi:MAG: hypothetical protein ABL907_19135 [Hyphomicrobium sp.]